LRLISAFAAAGRATIAKPAVARVVTNLRISVSYSFRVRRVRRRFPSLTAPKPGSIGLEARSYYF
jgi:hypothetical protein